MVIFHSYVSLPEGSSMMYLLKSDDFPWRTVNVMSPKANPIWGHDLDYFGISPTSRTSRTMARQSQPSRIRKLRVGMGGCNSRFGSHHCSRWPSWFAEGLWWYLSWFFFCGFIKMRNPQKGSFRMEHPMTNGWFVDAPRFRNSPVFIQMKSGSLWVSHEYCWNRGWRMDGCCKSDRHPKIAESWPNTLW